MIWRVWASCSCTSSHYLRGLSLLMHCVGTSYEAPSHGRASRPTRRNRSISASSSASRPHTRRFCVAAIPTNSGITSPTARHWVSRIDLTTGVLRYAFSPYDRQLFYMGCRYLKRILKELFEKQGYEDDGLYDWDAIKRQVDTTVPMVEHAVLQI
jgi:hypothetical protein